MRTEPTHGNTFRSQIDHTNAGDALEWTRRYLEEGATRFVLQPAMTTVDVLQAVRKLTDYPLTAYSVSTELNLVRGDGTFLRPGLEPILYEYYYMLRRCGADSVMTYVARDLSRWLLDRK
jgi:porphobilinogen synthase